MNITTNNVEVSTPFFHENNTAAMNSYEAPLEPLATAEPLATTSPTSLMKTSNRFANRFTTTRASPKETVALVQSAAQSEAISASENTFIYMM